jgi:hypothetical protein
MTPGFLPEFPGFEKKNAKKVGKERVLGKKMVEKRKR